MNVCDLKIVKIIGFSVFFIMTGCESKHLVYVQEASLGLNVSIGADGTNKMTLGYDRDVFSIVPKKNKNGDVMSLFSVNRAEIAGLDNIDVSEVVVGGEPAVTIAKDPDAVNQFRRKVYGE